MNALCTNVVRAELFKVVRKKRTYILAGLWWVVGPVLALIAGRVVQTNLSGSFVEGRPSRCKPWCRLSLHLTAWPASRWRCPRFISPTYYIIVLSLLGALFIGEERGQNMWKTVLVAQPNRLAVLAGKFAVAMLVPSA